MIRDELKERAKHASFNAYAPYSKVRIGAAVYADGKVYVGCNVENASYGLTVCAERNAIFAAIADGAKHIDEIAVWSQDCMPYPCGACRQVAAQFAPHCKVAVYGTKGEAEFDLAELLPHSFDITEDKE